MIATIAVLTKKFYQDDCSLVSVKNYNQVIIGQNSWKKIEYEKSNLTQDLTVNQELQVWDGQHIFAIVDMNKVKKYNGK